MWCDALTIKVREAGRTVNVHALVAVGVNADGQREVLGLDVASAEDGAGWLAFLRSLTARGLSGVRLVVSDAHRGLVDAIGATPAGRGVAAVPDPLPSQSADEGGQVRAAVGRDDGADHLRPAAPAVLGYRLIAWSSANELTLAGECRDIAGLFHERPDS